MSSIAIEVDQAAESAAEELHAIFREIIITPHLKSSSAINLLDIWFAFMRKVNMLVGSIRVELDPVNGHVERNTAIMRDSLSYASNASTLAENAGACVDPQALSLLQCPTHRSSLRALPFVIADHHAVQPAMTDTRELDSLTPLDPRSDVDFMPEDESWSSRNSATISVATVSSRTTNEKLPPSTASSPKSHTAPGTKKRKHSPQSASIRDKALSRAVIMHADFARIGCESDLRRLIEICCESTSYSSRLSAITRPVCSAQQLWARIKGRERASRQEALLQWFDIFELYSAIFRRRCERPSRKFVMSKGACLGKPHGFGNPVNKAKADITNDLVRDLSPQIHQDGGQYKSERKRVQSMQKLGERLLDLVETTDRGIIPLVFMAGMTDDLGWQWQKHPLYLMPIDQFRQLHALVLDRWRCGSDLETQVGRAIEYCDNLAIRLDAALPSR